MRFKKDTEEGQKYLNSLNVYIQALNAIITASEKILVEHSDVKDNSNISSMNAIFLALKKHSENAQDIYNKASSGKSIYSADFEALNKGEEAIENKLNQILPYVNDVLPPNADSFATAYYEQIKLLESFMDQSKKLYGPIKIHPELELEPSEMPQNKPETVNNESEAKPKTIDSNPKPEMVESNKSKVVESNPKPKTVESNQKPKVVESNVKPSINVAIGNTKPRRKFEKITRSKPNPYRDQYISEFKRLSQELADTDPWYSKGSPSYRELRERLDGFNSRLANCDPELFDIEFKNVMDDFKRCATGYRAAHSNEKLDNRQMKRLKIMNRFHMLGERFKNPAIDPTKDYASKIAEKYIHAKAIDTLTQAPKNPWARGILFNPGSLITNVNKIVASRDFRNTLPKTNKDLLGMVKIPGEIMFKSIEDGVQFEKQTRQFLDDCQEKNNKIFEQLQNAQKLEDKPLDQTETILNPTVDEKKKPEPQINTDNVLKPEIISESNSEPKNEELKKEESKKEEPKIEDSKKEEPTNEESKIEESKIEEPNKEEPNKEEPNKEEPKQEESKIEEPKIEDSKPEFKPQDNEQKQSDKTQEKMTQEEIDEAERQFAEIEDSEPESLSELLPVKNNSSTMSQKDQRILRASIDPNGGFGTFEEVLSDPEMEQWETQMLSGDEFNYSKDIPNNILLSADINELTKFKNEHPNLSDADKQYLDNHIASEKFYNKLEATKVWVEPKGPITRDDGTIILEHIKLNTTQTSRNGCYSCSEMLLLQSRGLFLDQRQIRNYRLEGGARFADDHEKERVSGDVKGNIINTGGIATRCLKNTAVQERTYSMISTAKPETKKIVAEDIKLNVFKALSVHKSPVSVLRDGHYVTVVGYNAKNSTLVYKNSLTDRDHKPGEPIDPNKEHTMTVDELLDSHELAIGYLMTINPEDPTAYFDEQENIEYVNGQYRENTPLLIGIQHNDDNPDGKLVWDKRMIGNGVEDKCSIQSVIKVPKKLEMTKEMEVKIGNKYKVVPLKDNHYKQDLKIEINKMEKDLFKDDDVISFSGNLSNGNQTWSQLSFKCKDKNVPNDKIMTYFYLQKLKAKIDIMTPWQVKHAFDPERIKAANDGMANNDAFYTLLSANGKSMKISQLGEMFVEGNKPEPQKQAENKELDNKQKQGDQKDGSEKKNEEKDFSVIK